MPPKRKASTRSLASSTPTTPTNAQLIAERQSLIDNGIVTEFATPKKPAQHQTGTSSPGPSTPATPSSAQLLEQREPLLAQGVAIAFDSSPLPPKKRQRKTSAPLASSNGKTEEEAAPLSPLPKTRSTARSKRAPAKQGTIAAPKPKASRKRKTTEAEGGSSPARKRKKSLPKKSKAIVVESPEAEENQEGVWENAGPLTLAIEHKLVAINYFLDNEAGPPLPREGDGNVVRVDELDVYAALIILGVDWGVESSELLQDDADGMVVARHGDGTVSVDFDRRCTIEMLVLHRLYGTAEGARHLNLVEVEIKRLIAHRKKLLEDGIPAAGFRVYEDTA